MFLFNLQLFSFDFHFFVFNVIKNLLHFFSAFSLFRPIQKFSYHDNHLKRHTYGFKVWLSIAAKSINLYPPLYGLAEKTTENILLTHRAILSDVWLAYRKPMIAITTRIMGTTCFFIAPP